MAGQTVTRAQLSEAVYQEVGLSRNESAELVETVLNEISSALARIEHRSGLSVRVDWCRRWVSPIVENASL